MVFRILKVAGLLLAIGCTTGSTRGPNKGIDEMEKSLVDNWKKLSTAECDKHYPDELEFHELATYLGKKGPDQPFIVWDAGTYQVADENHLVMSTATDELVSYRFSISRDVLTFVDDEGCEFRYQRLA
jgi:hypothetical protein